jgi:hypothetical protein
VISQSAGQKRKDLNPKSDTSTPFYDGRGGIPFADVAQSSESLTPLLAIEAKGGVKD